jgi:hypothetical protein
MDCVGYGSRLAVDSSDGSDGSDGTQRLSQKHELG